MKLLIDCDPGIDDAMALLFAFAQPNMEILGITTVEGNAPARMTYLNALRIAGFAGKTDIPIIRGDGYRIEQNFPTDCHGLNGLGECSLPVPDVIPIQMKSEDYLLKVLSENDPNTVTIVTVGPMTNLALAYQKDPQIFRRTEKIVSMGGGKNCGNITPYAEFNYWFDAKSAQTVYQSGVFIWTIGLDVTRQVLITTALFDTIRKIGTPTAHLMEEIMPTQIAFNRSATNRDGMTPHDLIAMAACIDPSLFTWECCHMEISTRKERAGESFADFSAADKNCCLATGVKAKEILSLTLKTLLPELDI